MDREIAPSTIAEDWQDLTEDMFCAWVGSASPGDHLAYHRGFLAIDTRPEIGAVSVRRKNLQRLARRAMRLAETDVVHLVQRREADGDFTYFAVARSRPLTAVGALTALLASTEEDDRAENRLQQNQIRRSA